MKIAKFYLLLLVSILILTACSAKNKGTNPDSLMEAAKLDTVTKIVFVDGRGGLNKPLTLEDKNKINEFLGYLRSCKVQKIDSPEPSAGWTHQVVFYNGGTQLSKITFAKRVIINSKNYYDVVKNEISTEKIDTFLQSIDPSW